MFRRAQLCVADCVYIPLLFTPKKLVFFNTVKRKLYVRMYVHIVFQVPTLCGPLRFSGSHFLCSVKTHGRHLKELSMSFSNIDLVPVTASASVPPPNARCFNSIRTRSGYRSGYRSTSRCLAHNINRKRRKYGPLNTAIMPMEANDTGHYTKDACNFHRSKWRTNDVTHTVLCINHS